MFTLRPKKRRNPIVRELNSKKYFQQVVPAKRKHLIDELHEQEAEEDLHEYFGLGKAPKE